MNASNELTYDYAKALAGTRRVRFLRELIVLPLLIMSIVGLRPFVKLFGDVGMLIGLASFALIGVCIAIRRAQQRGDNEVEAYEDRLLAKARKRSRKKRR